MRALQITGIIAIAVIATACNEIVEPDISGNTVVLISPPDNYQTTSVTNNFFWDESNGATHYRFQVASPNFTAVQQFIIDTLVEGLSFSMTLQPGTYEWRLKAVNGSSEGKYNTRSITIIPTDDLSGQTLILLSPSNNYFTNQATVTFKWDSIYSADDYRLQIIDSSTITIVDVSVSTNSFIYALNEGQYTWQVRAQNAGSNSPYTSRVLTVDITPPPVSTPLLNHGDSIFSPDTLFWARDASAYADSIFIYPDSLISTPVYSGSTTSTYYIFSGAQWQDYYWRLKTVDQAGNWSALSLTRKFWVKP